MPTVEKTSGGMVYVRSLDRRFVIGDQGNVSDEQAARLCDERGDFERVADELAEADVDEGDLVDTLENAGGADGESASGGPSESTESDPGTGADGASDADDQPDGESGTLPFNPEAQTNDEIKTHVADIDDEATLVALRNVEERQKDRTGAADAIDDRLDELRG